MVLKHQYYYKLLKCELVWMTIFGLYHNPKWNPCFRVYRIFILIILWLGFLNYFFNYYMVNGYNNGIDELNSVLTFKLVAHVFSFYAASNATCLYFCNTGRKKIEKFIKIYGEIFEYEILPEKQLNKQKKINKLIFVLTMSVCVGQSLTSLIGLFGTGELNDIFQVILVPLRYEEWINKTVAWKLVSWVSFSYATFAWMMPLWYFMIHCAMLYGPLETFNSALDEFSCRNKMRALPNASVEHMTLEMYFDELRKWQLKLISTIPVLNTCFKKLIFIAIVSNGAKIILFLHMLTGWKGNCITALEGAFYMFWLINDITMMLSCIAAAAKINYEVCC
jgi:hypothetical protein